MKNIAQKMVLADGGPRKSQAPTSPTSRVVDLPRVLLGYLGKMALCDEDIKPGSDRAKNHIRGRIAYK